MKYDQLAELAFAGLSLLPFPIFLGGYAELAGGVFFFLLGATGVLGWVEQFKTKGKPPARADADASSPDAAFTRTTQ